ncbi:MAG: prepilin peptidase [bacterium]|nr:prepilin peptidase [bacterium]
MEILFGFFFFILGTAIGSFLNVVIYRYNTGMGVNGRSKCFSCGKTLQWYELIPVFSYVFLLGRCSECQSKISWQYPLVEFLTGLTFLAVYLAYFKQLFISTNTILVLLYSLVAASIFIVILVYDVRHKIIPDGLVIMLSIISLIGLFISADLNIVLPAWSALLAGPILALPFAALWLLSQGRWMGLGDAKLALPMGWFLGLGYGLSAIMLAFWIGAAVGVALIAMEKLLHRGNLSMKSEIPFAPFLIVGFAIVYFFNINIIHLSTLFQ